MKVLFCVWNTPKDGKTLSNIQSLFRQQVSPDLEFEVKNISAYGEVETEHPCVIFGAKANSQVITSGPKATVADVDLLSRESGDKAARIKAAGAFKEFFEALKKVAYSPDNLNKRHEEQKIELEKPKQEQTNCVEVNGVKIGKGPSADIEITPEQTKYLLKLKELFGGGTITIENGDKKITV